VFATVTVFATVANLIWRLEWLPSCQFGRAVFHPLSGTLSWRQELCEAGRAVSGLDRSCSDPSFVKTLEDEEEAGEAEEAEELVPLELLAALEDRLAPPPLAICAGAMGGLLILMGGDGFTAT